ncbi:MAG: ribonuclease J [Candidatus Paceibacterota bacterium]
MTDNKDKLKIIPLGGTEEVGRNCTVFEYQDQILIVDLGLGFPEEDMPGVDYIIPNTKYLQQNSEKIKGAIITHGHYDHIGAIPHVVDRLGNPPIFTGELTQKIIEKRQEDYSNVSKPDIHQVEAGDTVELGDFTVEFFNVNHNIPNSLGAVIRTPVGNVIHTGDFKFDRNPVSEDPTDIPKLASLGEEGVLALLSDSTNAEKEGFSTSETEIKENLNQIFERFEDNRLIVSTFSSLISRVQQVFDLAEKHNRKVAVDGYSMKTNVEIAKELGYLKFHKGTQIPMKKVSNYKPEDVVILATGAQGEGNAALMRIAQGNHRHIKLSKKDVVIFSSSIVPGNENTVQSLKDIIFRQGAKVIDYEMMDIHTGGHAKEEDLKMLINLVQPKYLIPVEGNYYMLKLQTELAQKMGMPKENTVILGNGDMAILDQNEIEVRENEVPSNYVFVDGLGVGDVGEIVLRDRQKMSEEGMFVVIVQVNSDSGEVEGHINIISRGFVYLEDSKDLLNDARKKIKDIVSEEAAGQQSLNWSYLKDVLRDRLGDFLYQKTHRRPMVLPVVIEV